MDQADRFIMTTEPTVKVELTDQDGHPWKGEEASGFGLVDSEIPGYNMPREKIHVELSRESESAKTEGAGSTTPEPTPIMVKQWELKSQVNKDVLKFTKYSDGSCMAEVIAPKEKGRKEDLYDEYYITDSVRGLIDNPKNQEYGLNKDALSFIQYGKDAFDKYYKNGKIFPPIAVGSDEYYTIVLHNMRYGEEWVKDWKQTFKNVATFNIIAGAVLGAMPPKSEDAGNWKNIAAESADDVNIGFKNKGFEPPYKSGTQTNTIEFTQNTKAGEFVRVYDNVNSGQSGGWVMRAKDIEGLTPAQIQNKFALPSTPTHVTDVIFKSGDTVRTGLANSAFGFDGGGVQYDLMGQQIGDFINGRLLPR